MKRLVLFLPIVLILLTSGCTLPGGISIPGLGPPVVEYENDIVVIKELKVIPSTIIEEQTSRIIAYIQNIGDNQITNAEVRLYDYCTGMLEASITGCPGTPSEANHSCTINLLPKEIKEVDWEVKAPSGTVKLQSVCDLKIFVRYPYTKYQGLTTIHFINPQEMQAQLERGEFKEVTSYIAAGQGPVKAYLTVEDRQPIPASTKDLSITLALQIKNRGSGFLSGPGGRPVIPKDKIVLPEGIKEKFNTCFNKANITGLKLIQRESSKFPCKVTLEDLGITDPEKQVPKELTKQLTIKIDDYTYEFRASTRITVNPKT